MELVNSWALCNSFRAVPTYEGFQHRCGLFASLTVHQTRSGKARDLKGINFPQNVHIIATTEFGERSMAPDPYSANFDDYSPSESYLVSISAIFVTSFRP